MILPHLLLIDAASQDVEEVPACKWDRPIRVSELADALKRGDCELKVGTTIVVPVDDGSPVPDRVNKVKEEVMEPEEEHPEAPAPHGEGAHAPGAKGAVHEEVGAPDPGVADLSQFTALAENNSGTAIILALVAVVGGGAAWKFYSQHSAQKHELEMAKLEKGQNDHQACEAKRLELAGRVDALEKKLTSSLDVDGPSASDLDKKLKTLERRVREMKSKP